MEGSPGYHRALEHALTDLLARVVTRKRSSPLDPPVPLDLVAPDFEKFKGHPVQHIEQAARSCVYRIAVRPPHEGPCVLISELNWRE